MTEAFLIRAPMGSLTVPKIVPDVTCASVVDVMSVRAKSTVLSNRTTLRQDRRFMT
jgi:hypothetical protein